METNVSKTLLKVTSNRNLKKAYVDSKDGQIHYWTAGSGPTLLLIHQSSSSTEEYAAMVPYLSKHFHLVAFDWPGHGNSDDPSRAYGVEDYADSALVVMDHLEIDEFHVVGHHGGALLTMNLAWRFPSRIGKVILSGTSGPKDEEGTKQFLEQLEKTKGDVFERNGQTIMDTWNRYLKYIPEASPKEILIPFINNMVSKLRPYDAHHGVLPWDRRPALASLKNKEVLLIQGDLDVFVSEQEKLLEVLPLAKRVVIPGGGPFYFFSKPEVSASVILKFLLGS